MQYAKDTVEMESAARTQQNLNFKKIVRFSMNKLFLPINSSQECNTGATHNNCHNEAKTVRVRNNKARQTVLGKYRLEPFKDPAGYNHER